MIANLVFLVMWVAAWLAVIVAALLWVAIEARRERASRDPHGIYRTQGRWS